MCSVLAGNGPFGEGKELKNVNIQPKVPQLTLAHHKLADECECKSFWYSNILQNRDCLNVDKVALVWFELK